MRTLATGQSSPDCTPETYRSFLLQVEQTLLKSPMEVGQPIHPLQQRHPEYSTGFPPSQSYPSFYVVLKNWNRKCFWTSVVYIL